MDNGNSDPPPPYEQARYSTHDGLPSSQQIRADPQLLPLHSVSNTQARFQPEGELNLSRLNLAFSPDQQVGSCQNPDPPPSYEQATYNTQYGVHLSQQIVANRRSLIGLPRHGVSYPQGRLQPQGERNSSRVNQAFSIEQQVVARPKPGTEYTQSGFRKQVNRDQPGIKPRTSQPRPHRIRVYRQPSSGREQVIQTTQPPTPHRILVTDNTNVQPLCSRPTVLICCAALTICCFFPTGLYALCFAFEARSSVAKGNAAFARKMSIVAIVLTVTGFVLGFTWIGFVIYFFIDMTNTWRNYND